MVKPGSRQAIAQIVFAAVNAPVKPIEPMVTPCLPGFMTRKQAS